MKIILAIIAFIVSSLIALYNYFLSQGKSLLGIGNESWIITSIFILPLLIDLVKNLMKKEKQRIEDNDIETISDRTTEKVVNDIKMLLGKDTYTNGLSKTQDPQLQHVLETGTKELKRASQYQEALAKGDTEAAKQYHEATLKAIEHYQKGLSFDIKRSEEAALLNLIGIAYYRISLLDDALESWNKMKELAETMKFSNDEETAEEGQFALSVACGNMGNVYGIRGDLDKALEMHQKALNISIELDYKEGMAAQYGNMGIVCQIRGDLDKALEMYQKALDIDIEMGNKKGMAIQYGNMGIVCQIRGDLDKALEMYQKALDIFTLMGNKEGIAVQYGNMGIVYQIRGDLDKALEMYGKALDINIELGRNEGIAKQYGNMGIVYQIRGDLDKALEMYQKALEINEQLGRKEGIAKQYSNMGNVYRINGDLDKALEMYGKALEINIELGKKEGMAIQHANFAILYYQKGDKNKACQYLESALKLFTEIGAKIGIQKTNALLEKYQCR